MEPCSFRDVLSNLIGADIEASVRALLSDTQEETSRSKPSILFTEDKAATITKSFQAEGVSFTARGGPHDGASIAPGQMRKEVAWRAVKDLPDIPRMFYRLAGENGSSIRAVTISRLTRASNVLGTVLGVDGEGGGHV